mmetsp:Transcript_30918/g.63117  ORF Transcript_30918/g.63117 Transcript_30918/m.63117 type:complete len:197 (-) Transcript_30918:55-645(-)
MLLTYSFNNLVDDDDIQLNHSRYGHDFRDSLDNKERKKRANKVPRLALLSLHSSPWRKLIESSSDPALITFTGFDKNAFYVLLEIFAPYFDEYTPFTTNGKICLKRVGFGRPRKIRPEDCLGLSLAWTRTRGSKVQLNMTFGMTATNCALYIKFGEITHPSSRLWPCSSSRLFQKSREWPQSPPPAVGLLTCFRVN